MLPGVVRVRQKMKKKRDCRVAVSFFVFRVLFCFCNCYSYLFTSGSLGMMSAAVMPTAIPASIPENRSTGK